MLIFTLVLFGALPFGGSSGRTAAFSFLLLPHNQHYVVVQAPYDHREKQIGCQAEAV